MTSSVVLRRLPRRVPGLVLGMLAVATAVGPASAGPRESVDPARVVPLDKIAPEFRATVADVIRDHTLHRQGSADTFPCTPSLYLALLNEPQVTLSLWQDLSTSPVRLRQLGPSRYEGTDGAGTQAVWDFVYRSPKLHVLLADLDYTTPRGNARLDARIVLIIRSGFYREVNGEGWVQHDIEAYVKVDSKGWKALARTIRPIIEKVLDDQVREAGWFVSLMGRLVTMYPTWASQVTAAQAQIAQETRERFAEVVAQNRRPGAFEGRPSVADSSTGAETRTR